MDIQKISPKGLLDKIESQNVLILDVRAEEKYNDFHIQHQNVNSLNIPKTNILDLQGNEGAVDLLPKNKAIVVTCTTGNSATKCAAVLLEKNYNVVVLDGGITAWKEYVEGKL